SLADDYGTHKLSNALDQLCTWSAAFSYGRENIPSPKNRESCHCRLTPQFSEPIASALEKLSHVRLLEEVPTDKSAPEDIRDAFVGEHQRKTRFSAVYRDG